MIDTDKYYPERTVLESGEHWTIISYRGLHGGLLYSHELTNPSGGVMVLGCETTIEDARKWSFERDIILGEWYP